ncbi:uncharacterized protein LY89DRAFT_572394 [Mollisia scopiformis]|uniref:Rrn9 domain-containing protein n=1 Tax=Mollisia scopiformis TaxID=149040 RepID=A0A194XU58_MOLSC|nr:uncharacterized protein LY89DRAFT_572394 [Mollisia scopiformis]KUJ23855.1 hypothetical protein LY89DRAFT_572394 [Mollisia scopiformis]
MDDDDPAIPDSDASEDTEDSESLRPNRWQGAPSTWASLTAQERGLAASLDQIRNEDLSIHLYNAHALKRRARQFEENPEKEYPAIPDEDQTFKPPTHWTAWPLPPNEVPREGERIGSEDPDEKYTFRRRETQRPSTELEDVLLGLTLRFAKERFTNREENDEIGAQDDEEQTTVENNGRHNNDEASDSLDSEISDENDVVVKEGSAAPSEEPLIPVVSTDDDRSRGLLRPSIRHTLSKLDEVLMALHHARKACRRVSYSSASSEADSEQEGSVPISKRPRGRPRKFSSLPDRSRAQSMPSDQEMDEDGLFRAKTTHLGRPLKAYNRLDGESQQDYLVRIAKIQKKPLPPFAPPIEAKPEKSPTPSPRKSSKSPGTRATSADTSARRRKKLHPRDWSEVLSSAALVGFPPDVIARATRRCANLFGEGITMRTIIEMPFMEKIPDSVMRYVPEEIPDFDEESSISSSDESDRPEEFSEVQIKSERPTSRAIRKARMPPSKQTCFCSIENCPRRIQGFRDKDALRRHLMLGHKIAKDDLDEYILPSDEEMSGAVHVDGFLKPLKKLGGARGSYRRTGKRPREDETDSGDEEEEEEVRGPQPTPALKVESESSESDEDGSASDLS